MRSLSPEEAELWARVTATIQPLSREARPEPAPIEPEVARSVAERVPAKPKSRQPAVAPARVAPSGTLDGSWDKRLKTGTVQPDRVVDLQGLNLDQAWTTIDRALERAIGRQERIILLITGHARAGDPPLRRGRIRAAVHDWLAASRHSPSIAAVRGAHSRHGGGGSLYIILRRR